MSSILLHLPHANAVHSVLLNEHVDKKPCGIKVQQYHEREVSWMGGLFVELPALVVSDRQAWCPPFLF